LIELVQSIGSNIFAKSFKALDQEAPFSSRQLEFFILKPEFVRLSPII
jgi:hypothetical protein